MTFDISLKPPQPVTGLFLLFDDDEFEQKTKKCRNNNTDKCEQRAHKAFTNFLMAMDKENLDYWYYTKPELDNCLAKFWFGARKDLGEGHDDNEQQDSEEDPNKRERMYKASSLRNFCYSLNRILKSRGHLYDITARSTTSFGKSQKAFIDAIKELKEEGKGDIESYPEI